MGTRVILVAVMLGLTVVTVTLARQQPGDAAKLDQKQREAQPQAGLATAAALRCPSGQAAPKWSCSSLSTT